MTGSTRLISTLIIHDIITHDNLRPTALAIAIHLNLYHQPTRIRHTHSFAFLLFSNVITHAFNVTLTFFSHSFSILDASVLGRILPIISYQFYYLHLWSWAKQYLYLIHLRITADLRYPSATGILYHIFETAKTFYLFSFFVTFFFPSCIGLGGGGEDWRFHLYTH